MFPQCISWLKCLAQSPWACCSPQFQPTYLMVSTSMSQESVFIAYLYITLNQCCHICHPIHITCSVNPFIPMRCTDFNFITTTIILILISLIRQCLKPIWRFPMKESQDSCVDLGLGEPWAGKFWLIKDTYLNISMCFILLIWLLSPWYLLWCLMVLLHGTDLCCQ